jgi:hypothetical protein
MVVKLDIANDFDRVRHSFLFQVIERFEFISSFIRWVAACIGNLWISPLVNGRSIGFFQASRGLRQGYLLLFIIVVEALSRKLKKEIELGNLLGLQITRVVKNMNHSQLVDDTLLLGGASIIIFKSTVESFLDVFGGVVNNRKCQVYGWNTSPRFM